MSEAPKPKKPKRPSMITSAGTSQRLQSRDDYGLVEISGASDAREFLLAERPRLVRATLWLSLLLLAALIGWACVGTVDVTVQAPGIVRPRGNVLQVQSPVSGVVTEVLVREGSTVGERDVILRFDPKPLRAERAVIEEKINAKRAERQDCEETRKRLAHSFEADRQALQVEIGGAEKQIELEKVNRDYQVRVAEAKLATVEADLATLESKIQLQAETVATVRRQFQGGAKTKDQLDQEERGLRGLEADVEPKRRDVAVAKIGCEPNNTQVKIAENQLETTRSRLAKEQAAYEIKDGEAAARINQVDGEIRALGKELNLVDNKLLQLDLRAPVAGLVTRLNVTHAGRVVPEGSTVAEISPSGRDLVLEAYVRNEDRGDIKAGRRALVRFAAFPYQEYGALDGEVVEVAPDVAKMPADAPVGASPDGAYYKVTVSMPRLELQGNRGKTGRVELGMAAQADIVVKESPLIFIFLDEVKSLFDTRKQ